ncbi:SNX13-like protein [Mya arenaria]|uniref:SNX13-like protein n=1 Tax=Mya arenaria TaxID=6604 RepID=A0ABY7EML2_MYAAR|nr:SNX13-like protein [Mya arenaria]
MVGGQAVWITLAVILYLFTFGSFGVALIFYILLGIAGAVAIAFYYGSEESSQHLLTTDNVPLSAPGISEIQMLMEGSLKIRRFDKRITGASVIDEVLQSEVLVNGVLVPTIDLLCDPDYINSYIAWMCKEGSFTNEMFMSVIKYNDNIEELVSIVEKIDCDIAKWRSKDTGGTNDTQIKQNLNSLLFVKKQCEEKISRLQQGIDDTEFAPDVPEHMRSGTQQFMLSLDDIIKFMTNIGGEYLLFFYLNIEGFRAAAEQQLEVVNNHGNKDGKDLEPLRKQVNIIYNQYLSDKATSRVRVEPAILKRCAAKIKSKQMQGDVFDEVQARVYQMLHGEQYYHAFIQSQAYMKVLDDLGFDNKNEDSDTLSIDDNSTRSNSPCKALDYSITAQISQTGIITESEKTGKSYAVFSIRVTKSVEDEEEIFDVYRRYSDFHDLQMIMTEKLPTFYGPSLPPKSLLKSTNKDFLEKRRKALDNYLQMDTIVNPLKTVGNAVINQTENIKHLSSDGFSKLRGNSLNKGHSKSTLQGTKVAAGLDPEIVEHVDLMTSADQVAVYIKTFRESFWPEGVLAEPRPERNHLEKMRTRVVCKTKMHGSIPDELRHFLGSDTVRIGTSRVFDMFQYRSLNRRLVYVVLEGVIETLFPQNRFNEMFRKMHSQSSRLKVRMDDSYGSPSLRKS